MSSAIAGPGAKCPCGVGTSYEVCCAPLHQGQVVADTAEALMRSRYSAFIKHAHAYIFDTTHPSKRSNELASQLREQQDAMVWLSLRILRTEAGQKDDSHGEVEFIAFFQHQQQVSQHHELSLFEKIDGGWYYLSGQFLPDLEIGRNDLCWCGS